MFDNDSSPIHLLSFVFLLETFRQGEIYFRVIFNIQRNDRLMYIGRIVAAGMTPNGNVTAAYRVSSRSFPNRTAQLNGETVAIMPRRGHESDLAKCPYIAYNAVRLSGSIALATNGSQTDPVIEKIAMGMPVRDAMTLVLLAMDYEKDRSPRRVSAPPSMRSEKSRPSALSARTPCLSVSLNSFPAKCSMSPHTRKTRPAGTISTRRSMRSTPTTSANI